MSGQRLFIQTSQTQSQNRKLTWDPILISGLSKPLQIFHWSSIIINIMALDVEGTTNQYLWMEHADVSLAVAAADEVGDNSSHTSLQLLKKITPISQSFYMYY